MNYGETLLDSLAAIANVPNKFLPDDIFFFINITEPPRRKKVLGELEIMHLDWLA